MSEGKPAFAVRPHRKPNAIARGATIQRWGTISQRAARVVGSAFAILTVACMFLKGTDMRDC